MDSTDRTPTPTSSSWWTKSRRAANDQDYETWKRGGVCPTLNAFDNATETRATVLAIQTANGNMQGPIHSELASVQTNPRRIAISGEAHGVRRLTPLECERLMGLPDDWTAGHADSVRYRQCGNAVVVPVAEWIGYLLGENA